MLKYVYCYTEVKTANFICLSPLVVNFWDSQRFLSHKIIILTVSLHIKFTIIIRTETK